MLSFAHCCQNWTSDPTETLKIHKPARSGGLLGAEKNSACRGERWGCPGAAGPLSVSVSAGGGFLGGGGGLWGNRVSPAQ